MKTHECLNLFKNLKSPLGSKSDFPARVILRLTLIRCLFTINRCLLTAASGALFN